MASMDEKRGFSVRSELDLLTEDYSVNAGHPRSTVWLIMKVDHTGTPVAHAVCQDVNLANDLVKILKGNSFVNHALCFKVPYYGPEVVIKQDN